MSEAFEADLDAAAGVGWGPDEISDMARIGFEPGQFAQFRAYDKHTRTLILRILGGTTDPVTMHELAQHPGQPELSEYLLTLPAFRAAETDDEEESELPPTLRQRWWRAWYRVKPRWWPSRHF